MSYNKKKTIKNNNESNNINNSNEINIESEKGRDEKERIRSLSTINYIGIKNVSQPIASLMKISYQTRLSIPRVLRTLISQNTNQFDESYIQQIGNMPLNCIYRDYIHMILMSDSKPIDEDILNYEHMDMITLAYPICVLDLDRMPSGNEKTLTIRLGDFKYYLFTPDKIIEIPLPSDLKYKEFTSVEYRIEDIISGETITRHTEPIKIKIFATSPWNKEPLERFKDICPIDVDLHNNQVIYKSVERPSIYTVRSPFLMFATPVVMRDGIPHPFLDHPLLDYTLLAHNDEANKDYVSYIKIQNFYSLDEKDKILDDVRNIILKVIQDTIENVNNIPEGSLYRDVEQNSPFYNAFIRFMIIYDSICSTGIYEVNINKTVTIELKKLINEYLIKLYDNIKTSTH